MLLLTFIRVFGLSKIHDHDNIVVRMIKLSANVVAHPLNLMFQNFRATDAVLIE